MKKKMKKINIFILLLIIFLGSYRLYGKEEILMSAGEQRSVRFDEKIKKIAIGDPAIADVRALSSLEILINAKKEGSTSLIVWTKSRKITKKIIVSKIDVKAVLSELRTLLKGVKGIRIRAEAGKVILDGEIINAKDIPIVEKIVKKYRGKIINFVKLPVQMIKINARIVEIWTSDNSAIGIDWQKKFQFVEEKIKGVYSIGKISRTTKIDAVLDLFIKEGKAKIVARPNIIVINGRMASFHSGGKLLVPVISENNLSIEEKPYGVDLKILPYGDRKSNLIKTKVNIEVSTVDWENAVKYAGGTIPAIKNRNIETEIDVKLGKTIVIAGLLMEEEQTFEKKIPILGHIPLLGLLFTSKEVKKYRTELVVFLTPSFINFLGEEIIE